MTGTRRERRAVRDAQLDAWGRRTAARVETGAGRFNNVGHRVLFAVGVAVFVVAAVTGGDGYELFAGVVCMIAGWVFWHLPEDPAPVRDALAERLDRAPNMMFGQAAVVVFVVVVAMIATVMT